MNKKNLILFILVALSSAFSADAQVKVHSSGIFLVGDSEYDEFHKFYNAQRCDTVSKIKVYGKEPGNAGGRIAFGDNYDRNNLNAVVGEAGGDSDKLWLHGFYGIIATAGSHAADTVFYYDSERGDYFLFGCDVRTSGVFVASDTRFKENIRTVDDALVSLKGLSGVSYNLKSREVANCDPNELGVSADKAAHRQQVMARQRQRQETQQQETRYGFIAQDMERVMPELVHMGEDGMKYVDYIGLIPLLVNAVNELSGELETVKARNAELERQINAPTVNYAPAMHPTDVDGSSASRAVELLAQNDPNPFSSDTRISYFLPEGAQSAIICIYDLQGKQVEQLAVTGPDAGSVTLRGGNLQAGMYIYSLIANGKELASKKMILTK